MPDPSTPILEKVLSLPMRIRVGLWLALGSAMGIPVDALFQAINADLDTARKLLGRKQPRLSSE